MPLWKRALKQPANVQKVVQSAMAIGPKRTWSMVRGQLSAGNATGYSAAGVVIDVGEGVDDVRVGDRVACAGAQSAHHAEVIRVPRNLSVLVPEHLAMNDACTVTLGAIALQGVRRAAPTLGETFVVVGMGILGQITAQLLRANGCQVIGVDLDRDRIARALELGMDLSVDPDEEVPEEQVARLTDGLGADGVIITAAGASDAIVSTAFKMCRKKGRVVLVGDVGLQLNRADFYEKEIDFLISTSYGPGRYDRGYEERGLEYPAAYVRWTENRNMEEYLRLLASGRVQVGPLVNAVYPVERAPEAYAAVRATSGPRPLMVLLSYPEIDPTDPAVTGERVVRLESKATALGRPRVRLALVGAGGFAKGMHLPNLRALSDQFELRGVVSRTGHNATATANQFGAQYASTDYARVLEDADIDAVLIATRHDAHAEMVLRALQAGKHVLVEKPLCLNQSELDRITAFYDEKNGEGPVLLTGFNRRFSPSGRAIAGMLAGRATPVLMNYRMNAGRLPADHWTQGPQGGGRNIGEACHLYDLFTYLTNSRVKSVKVHAVRPNTHYYSHRDNFVATIAFDDGSVGSLVYTALGSKKHPKEQMELFVDGKVISLDDYVRLEVAGSRKPAVKSAVAEKGQLQELAAFADAILKGGDWPIPLWQQAQAMEIAFEVERQLEAGG
jgi:predicted dehydrogenase/threonine dehydrogenase-like Zn-dependent dehydrogenase